VTSEAGTAADRPDPGTAADRPAALAADLLRARSDFLAALAAVDPARLARPGLLGEWSGRELIAHMGYWCGHGTEALHLAEQGRLDEFVGSDLDVEARNETMARVARETAEATVRRREQASFEAFVERIRRVDPEMLDARVRSGETLEFTIREDGARHYDEHTEHLRAAAPRPAPTNGG
jgi:DinB superfamily